MFNQNRSEYYHNAIYLHVHTADPLVGRYCGLSKPAPVVSDSSTLVVQFISDTVISKKGFQAKWKAVSGELLCLAVSFTNTVNNIFKGHFSIYQS